MKEEYVTLAHGAGGKKTAQLIETVFRAAFENPYFTADDAAVLRVPQGELAMTTDSFIVSPAFFPGGNIGKLSICGTVNDLACMGAEPLYMTCGFIIEEGFPLEKLKKVAEAMSQTAREAGVLLVAGDTKVVGKGQADGVFINTTGIGRIMDGIRTSGALARPGDVIIVTGDVGRHGCTILLEREDFGIEADIKSDCAPLWKAVRSVLLEVPDVHVIRDATRGGVGTVLYEIAGQSGVGCELNSEAVPVDPAVRGVCGMLGLEPLYLACEGTMVMIAPGDKADRILDILHGSPHTQGARAIGKITKEEAGRVVMRTRIGALTLLPPPGGELLPRIC
ncbi:MAG: hydrogenase expression/formation protein HypE [Lachnospiraceae bacterium]|nr:hydrogenase expression/formation protein HypE [Lachnospiraceae bacterium]